jgi:integrase/recombinase XerD
MLPEAGKTGSFQRFYKKSDIICIMTHSLTSSDIKQFQSYLMDSNVKLNTAKKYVRDVKKLAHFLSDQTQTLSQNSLDAFLKSLPEAGYEALLRTALEQKNYRQVLMIQIFAVTDIRMNELRYLTVEALDAGVIKVPRAGESFEIFLPQDLVGDLYEYIDFQEISEGIIFCTRKGTPLDRSYIWKQMKELAVDAGIDPDKVYPQNLKRQLVRSHFSVTYP